MSFTIKQLAKSFVCLVAVGVVAASPAVAADAPSSAAKPTIVLVHGAFAQSASWNGVITRLLDKGFKVVAVANPLRSVKFDANYVAGVIDAIPGAIVLVGHSYGGSVITNAADGKAKVKALVYVSAFAPDVGETALALTGKFPGATLGPALAPPVALADGGKDLYILQDKFPAQFAADVPLASAKLMAASQRPIAEAALGEASAAASWNSIPTWFIYGSLDKNIPPAALRFMAQRAGSKKTVEIKGGSHVVMTSHPAEVSQLIDDAAVSAR